RALRCLATRADPRGTRSASHRFFQDYARPNSPGRAPAGLLARPGAVAAGLGPPSCRGRAGSARPARSGRCPPRRRCPLFVGAEARGGVGTTRGGWAKPVSSKHRGSTQSFDVDARTRRWEWTAPPCQLHDTIPALPIKPTSDRSSYLKLLSTVLPTQLGPVAAGAAVANRDPTTGVIFYPLYCFSPPYCFAPRDCLSNREGFVVPIEIGPRPGPDPSSTRRW